MSGAGEGVSGWVPALAVTTALFGTTTAVLAVALVCMYCRLSRNKHQGSFFGQEMKDTPYWIAQEPTLDENIDTSTPNSWYPPESSETFCAGEGQKEKGKVTTSVSLVQVNPRSLAQVGPQSIAQAGLKSSTRRKVQPKRVAPPPPRSKKGKSRRAARKHMSKDNDYDWPEIARDYQNLQQFLGTPSPQAEQKNPSPQAEQSNPYKALDIDKMNTPSEYAQPFSKSV